MMKRLLLPISVTTLLLVCGCSPKEEPVGVVPEQPNSMNQKLVDARVSSEAPSPSPTEEPKIASLNGDYDMDVECDTDEDMHIKKISITGKTTTVEMTYINKSGREDLSEPGNGMSTAAPGELAAFYIADPESRAEYKLLNVEGITISPKRTPVQKGESVDFTLTFERIPDTMTKFHMIEGKQQTLSDDGRPMDDWKFMNVKLRH